MKFILLCGGIGKRCNNYSLPKPLNYVGGKHMIEYIIESIPADEIYIIYNIFLEQYNFEEIVINLFKKKQFFFSKVDYLTRGAVETAYIGLQIFNLNIKAISLIPHYIKEFFVNKVEFDKIYKMYKEKNKNCQYL
jgi:NDP-sugar pyrophosphorylase family protein